MPRPPAAELHREIARAIIEQLRAASAEPGEMLSEHGLAQSVGTSRAPVRGALRLLQDARVLQRRADGRMVLRLLPAVGDAPWAADPETGEAERLYWRIAADRVSGALSDQVSEAGLMRRYDSPRGAVHRALLQVLGEGWIERAPAGGWRFLPVIDGPGSYDESYRFRRAIEPAALLDPAFVLAPKTGARLRREQEDLLARVANQPDPREVFELNSGFHLALMQASNNRFFADAGLRVTHLRRLVGYVIAQDHSRLAAQTTEHLAILERIEAGDRVGAAGCLVDHLDAGRASKARLLEHVGRRDNGLVGFAAGVPAGSAGTQRAGAAPSARQPGAEQGRKGSSHDERHAEGRGAVPRQDEGL